VVASELAVLVPTRVAATRGLVAGLRPSTREAADRFRQAGPPRSDPV